MGRAAAASVLVRQFELLDRLDRLRMPHRHGRSRPSDLDLPAMREPRDPGMHRPIPSDPPEDVKAVASTSSPSMVRGDVEQMLAAVAQAEGIDPPEVRWADVAGGTTTLTQGRHVITLGHAMLEDPERVRFTALHELGHVALRHMLRWKVALRVLALLVTALFPITGAVALARAASGDPEVTIAAGFAAALLSLLCVHLPLRLLFWPLEYAADDFAARHGAAMTPHIAEQHAALGLPRRIDWLLSTHPTPAARLQRAKRRNASRHSLARGC